MTDHVDLASELETWQRDEALATTRQAAPTGLSATHCQMDECGEPIPQARQDAVPGVRFCVDCQKVIERGNYLKRTYRWR